MRFGESGFPAVITAVFTLAAAATSYGAEPDVSIAIVSDESEPTALQPPTPRTIRLPRVVDSEPATAATRGLRSLPQPTTAESNRTTSQVVQAVHTSPAQRKSPTGRNNRRRTSRRVTQPRLRTTNPPTRTREKSASPRRSEPAGYSTAAILIRANQIAQRAQTEEQYSQIVEHCEQALTRAPSEEISRYARSLASWALNRRGQLLTDAGDQQTALRDFSRAVQYDPRRWRAVHNRGVSQAQIGQFAAAFDDFSETIRLKPDFAKAYSNRGTLYLEAGDAERARADFNQAVRLDGQLVNARFGHGRAAAQMGDYGAALASFDTALKLDDENVESYCGRGGVYADLGEYQSALADYAKAIELDPDYVEAYRQGAWLLATCPDDGVRDAENAVLGAQKAVELNGSPDHQLLDTLAAALASAGDFDKAVATLQQAIETAPDNIRQEYRGRLQLYQRSIPYRTLPPVQQTVFVEQP